MNCSRDCFNCPFPDCVLDDSAVSLSPEELRGQDRRDDEAFKSLSPSERRRAHAYSKYHDDPVYREAAIARARASYERNRDRVREVRRQYYKANAEKIKAQNKQWANTHREKLNARAREKRAEKRRAEMLEWGGPAYRESLEKCNDGETDPFQR